MQTKPQLEFVSTIQDIEDNIRTFNKQAQYNLGTIKEDYFTRGRRYWVYDSDISQFGPGKFVAYKEMTFELRECLHCYEKKCQSQYFNGVWFNGTAAHKRITDVVREELGIPKKFNAPDKSLINEFENWSDQLGIDLIDRLGTDLSRIITDKYKFFML